MKKEEEIRKNQNQDIIEVVVPGIEDPMNFNRKILIYNQSESIDVWVYQRH